MAAINSSFLPWNSCAPFFARSQIDEELRVVKAAGIGAVVGTPDLADNLLNFGKVAQARAARVLPCRGSKMGQCLVQECREPRSAPSSRCGRNSEPIIPLIAMKIIAPRADQAHTRA